MTVECETLSAHGLWKSDLEKSMASFEYSVLSLLLKQQTASCHRCLSTSFGARGWVGTEHSNLKKLRIWSIT